MKNKNDMIKELPQWRKQNKSFDSRMMGVIYACAIITMIVVLGIVGFIFINGYDHLSWNFFTNDYDDKTVYADFNFSEDTAKEIKLKQEGKGFAILDLESSALSEGVDQVGETHKLGKGDIIYSIDGKNLANLSVEEAQDTLSDLTGEHNLRAKITGGGIKPMVISTLMLIVLTLIFSVPIGVGAAVYLNEYAKEGTLLKIIRFAIESLAGIPSIIYGLFGMLFFVTLLRMNFSVLAGALTVAIILLPTIISTTEEALKAIPKGLREGSYALGATQFQTVSKVVIPNAIPGILTAIVLSVGRIIGESAALLLTAGTVARIPQSVLESASTITVKVYTVTKEEGNIEMACAMGIVIIVIILVLNALTRSLQRLRRIK